MMLTLQRSPSTETYTRGTLSIDGAHFCDTIEDPERSVKIAGKTAIPKGHYKVLITMSTRFKRLMPLLLNVPNFSGVRIHSGNTAEDTEGCVLVGTAGTLHGDGAVVNSRIAFNNLYDILSKSLNNNEIVTIEII